MSSLLAAAMVSSWFSCADIENVPRDFVAGSSERPEPILYQQWPEFVCAELFKAEREVKVRLLSENGDAAIGSELTREGKFSVNALQAGRMRVQWQAGSGVSAELWLQVEVTEPTWIYTDDFSVGYGLQSADIELRRMDVSRYLGLKELALVEPSGASVAKFVRRGNPAFSEDLRPPALVERLSRVKVVVKTETIQIQTSGLAQSMGWLRGERVNVRLEESGEIIQGVVADEGVVNVEI